jgi:phenylpyruvate tautomerase PptA (4-oxalocrotonate tautomerase family)
MKYHKISPELIKVYGGELQNFRKVEGDDALALEKIVMFSDAVCTLREQAGNYLTSKVVDVLVDHDGEKWRAISVRVDDVNKEALAAIKKMEDENHRKFEHDWQEFLAEEVSADIPDDAWDIFENWCEMDDPGMRLLEICELHCKDELRSLQACLIFEVDVDEDPLTKVKAELDLLRSYVPYAIHKEMLNAEAYERAEAYWSIVKSVYLTSDDWASPLP